MYIFAFAVVVVVGNADDGTWLGCNAKGQNSNN